jgi:transposase-like protein
VYLALGIKLDGYKELPGLWIGEHEGTRFWLNCYEKAENEWLALVDYFRTAA